MLPAPSSTCAGFSSVMVRPASFGEPSKTSSACMAWLVREPLVAPGVLRQRRVREVDHVGVKVNDQTFCGFEHREGADGRAMRIRADLLDVDDGQAQPPNRLPLAWLGLLWAPGEEDDLLGREERDAAGDGGELGRGHFFVEHVRHPHPIERPFTDAGRDIEVGVEVEVDEADPAMPRVPSDRPDADRAVAAKHERQLVGGRRDPLGRVADESRRPCRGSGHGGSRGRVASAR